MPRLPHGAFVALSLICAAALGFSCATQPAPTATARPTTSSAPVAPALLTEAARLRGNQRYEEARQAYSTWLASHPDDPDPTFDLGYTIYLEASAESSAARGNALRLQARDLFEKSRRLGSTWPDLIPYGNAIAADGGDARRYSALPAAADLIRRGETAFSAGRFPEAISLYAQALAIDRRAYPAALFTGDVYFT